MITMTKSKNPMTPAMTAASALSGTVPGGGGFVEELNTVSVKDGLTDSVVSVGARGALESEVAETVLTAVLVVVNTSSVRGPCVEVGGDVLDINASGLHAVSEVALPFLTTAPP